MPAATPLPRGPSVLTLYSAADLLTAPGCPVCRYASEAADRYLGWFALEGHSQPEMITTLCGSLGMCARHSRKLMRQPGAAFRLTAVYRYVVTAARDRLAGSAPSADPCPACLHDDQAARRALGTLVDGLASGEALSRCRDLGGVCIPHLADAARSGPRRVTAWLADTMRETLGDSPARLGWLAGADHDAQARALLRRALPAAGLPVPGTCAACLEAAWAERDSLARWPAQVGNAPGHADPGQALCAEHLTDASLAAAGTGRPGPLLAWQAACLAPGTPPAGRLAILPGHWPRRSIRDLGRSPGCPVCRAGAGSARRALTSVARASGQAPRRSETLLCVRHHLILHQADQQMARALAPGLAQEAALLIGELADAFELNTWAHRGGGPARQSAVWQHAAAFLDGSVFGGCAPPLE